MDVGVLIQLSHKNIDKIFDYKVPSRLESKIKIGIRVEVPFGYQKLEGFVLEIKGQSSYAVNLKQIIEVVDEEIVLNKELLDLGKFIKKQTLSTLISCYQVMLPKALKARRGSSVSKKYDIYYRLGEIGEYKLNTKQQEVINLFTQDDLVSRKRLLLVSASSVKTLEQKGILIPEKKEHYRLCYNSENCLKYSLTDEQKQVVNQVLENKEEKVSLLWGVTGSGKTEVYMELIENTLKKGKTSIMLVPEISLTPQMVERFEKRFGNKIAAIHSALSEGERYDEWRRIHRGEAKIVIGARSAIFAPLNDLGMIIIDEEHSDSYKQEDSSPRYSAIDVARERGRYNKCPVILGSATPSLESFARAQKGFYQLLMLPHRVNKKSLPSVEIVDMNEEYKKNVGLFSKKLFDKISEKIEKKEQVILLLNRRGYSSFVTCKNCGYTVKCPHCDITLTYHKHASMLRCHYCGYATNLKVICPECHENSLTNLGIGTEKVEEELHKLFPNTAVLRMDVDTTSRKGMHKKMIEDFRNQKYSILLGTQIVAKGLDFENVTLVGVINADTSLNIPDFRSSENTFSLLSQVAGRSGRSEKVGEVVIQTFNPSHYAISFVKKHDYIGFYKQEMTIRKTMKYPPYYYLVYIRLSGKDYSIIEKEAQKIKKSLERYLEQTIILGPSPASIFKLNDVYRYSIILKYKKESNLYLALIKMDEHYKNNKDIKVEINFNPIHF